MKAGVIRKRIEKELLTIEQENHLVKVDKEDTYYTVVAKLFGPTDTVFENGEYLVRITVNLDSYPFNPPEVIFLSEIYHPNISGDSICIDILQDQWSSAMTLLSTLKSLENLLNDPNPDSPLDSDAAEAFMSNSEEYSQRNAEMMIRNKENPVST